MTTKPLRIAALCGPTASGKTAAAIALRQEHGLPIEAINLDALQVYRDLSAGTAKPTPEERAALPYHLLDCADPQDPMNAARFAELADAAIADVLGRGAWPLLVGGTGLYLRAVLRGMAEIPEVPAEVRDALAREWQERGPAALHDDLRAVDPAYAASVPKQNRQRVLRALEVWRATGRAFSDWHAVHATQPDRYEALVTVLEPPADALRARIEARAEAMAAPLLAEVAALLASGLPAEAPAMQALGYRDAVGVVRGELPAEGFAAALAQAHWLYARRQKTWFRALPVAQVLHGEPGELAALAGDLRGWFLPVDVADAKSAAAVKPRRGAGVKRPAAREPKATRPSE